MIRRLLILAPFWILAGLIAWAMPSVIGGCQ